jgi:hypothetical protein
MARLLTDFEAALPALTKAVFSQPIDKTADQKVIIRPVMLRGELRYQLEQFRDNKAFHRNLTGDELLKVVENQLESRYRQALAAYRTLLREKALSPSLRIAAAFKVGRALEKLHLGAEAVDQYYVQVVTAYCDGLRDGTWYDADARTFFSRAAFVLADFYEARGESRQAVRVLEYVIRADVPAAAEARRRIARLTKKGGVW